MKKKYSLGGIILKDGKEIVAKAVISVGTGTSGPARAMKEALEQGAKKIPGVSIVSIIYDYSRCMGWF